MEASLMDRISLTDILAIWGAVVSSFVAGWNIFRDVIKRDRLQVYVAPMKVHPGGGDVFSWTITNAGRNDMHVTQLSGSEVQLQSQPVKRIATFFRIMPKAGRSFLFPFQHMSGSLPARIEPRNSITFYYDLSRLRLPLKVACFFAISADGRHWRAPRSNVEKTLANTDYQKHARKPAAANRPLSADGEYS